MISSYLNQDGYKVNITNWVLYNDEPAASPITLTNTAPAVSFRCRATVTSATGHTDCTGSLVIGTETLTFTASGQKKTTTIPLTSLPTVTYTGLDCTILIEAIDLSGANIKEETATTLKCRFQNTQKTFLEATGKFAQAQAIAYTDESGCEIGTKFSFGGYDYDIAQTAVMTGLSGSEEGRKLWLTGKTLAPIGRAVVEADMGDMRKATYDTDEDGIVDRAEEADSLKDGAVVDGGEVT